jgi:hypothetical protein
MREQWGQRGKEDGIDQDKSADERQQGEHRAR